MPFNDLDVFSRAAQALLQGRDPYAVPGVYYPLPFFFIFFPLATLPPLLAHVIWTLIGAMILIAILRLRALVVLFFMPVYLAFLMGQIVMPMLGVFALLRSGRFGGIALAVLILKPQLVFLLAPWLLWRWWKNDPRQIALFATTLALLVGAAFVVQADWVYRWLSVSGERVRAPISPSVWGMLSFLPAPVWILSAGLVTVVVAIWAWRTNDFDLIGASGFLVNPLLISYDLTLLTVMIRDWRVWLALTVLSWITFAASAWQLSEAPMIFITLAILIALVRQRRERAVLDANPDADRVRE